MNIETTNFPVYDIPDLKDKIIKIKASYQQLVLDKEAIAQQIQEKEKKFIQVRQEFAMLAPNEELRWQTNDNNDEDFEDLSLDAQRFKIMNDKLEMQLLIQEIHSVLPQLEAEVKRWEAKSSEKTRSLNKATKDNKNLALHQAHITKTTTDLEESMKFMIDSIITLKANQTLEIDHQKRQNQVLGEEIGHLRRELNRLLQEQHVLQSNVLQMRVQAITEKNQINYLKKAHIEARDSLERIHNGRGWCYELFNQLQDESGEVSVDQIAEALRPWVFTADQRESFNNNTNLPSKSTKQLPSTTNNTSSQPLITNEFITNIMMELLGITNNEPIKQEETKRDESKQTDEYEFEEDEEEELHVMTKQISINPKNHNSLIPEKIDWTLFASVCKRVISLIEK